MHQNNNTKQTDLNNISIVFIIQQLQVIYRTKLAINMVHSKSKTYMQ